MNKTQYFTLIQNMEKNELIELISKAYDVLLQSESDISQF